LTRRRKAPPSNSFSPMLHATWNKAVKEGSLRIKAGLKSDATRLRYQLYSLRNALRVEGDSLYALLINYQIAMVASSSTGDFYLELTRGDSHLDKILQDSGIELEEAPDPSSFLNLNLPPLEGENLEQEDQENEAEEHNPYIEGPKKKGANVSS
jgi:hypothetical protein